MAGRSVREPTYLPLTLLMLASAVLVTSAPAASLVSILGVFLSAATLLATAYMTRARRRQWLLASLFGALALAPLITYSVRRQPMFPDLAHRIYPVSLSLWLLFTFYVTLMVFRSIVTAPRVRGNEIYGAIYVYLLIGILFAQAFQLLLFVEPDALRFGPGLFPEPVLVSGALRARGPGDILYYSFITLATVGYGDVTPSSPLARSLSLIEAVIGIMYVATMIARFVATQVGAGERDPRSP
jgi:hypothetical protein